MTANDHKRLTGLLTGPGSSQYKDRNDLKALQGELSRARIVGSHDIPPTVVTMNTRLRYRDLNDGSSTEATLVFPTDANIDEGKMSVLSPIGTALLGYAKGDTIEWAVPSGTRRIQIEDILYQPEAAGDYHL